VTVEREQFGKPLAAFQLTQRKLTAKGTEEMHALSVGNALTGIPAFR
jgi:alkylation response protein AidB-like acyl-CoA dehydrogenase